MDQKIIKKKIEKEVVLWVRNGGKEQNYENPKLTEKEAAEEAM